jgi:alpha-glucosidase
LSHSQRYTDEPDYNLPQAGTETFKDFWFNNVTFPDPAAQLAEYAAAPLFMRFGGIRKPRLGNTELLNMARNKSWLVGAGSGDGGGRNLNYTRADVQTWYAAQQAPLLKAGVEYFWNDEGETSFFTFHWWNAAQVRTLAAHAPGKRFLTINRAFTPGMSRMGLVVWTGDVSPQWGDLQATPGYVLNWGLAGAAHVTCDIGGFSGDTTALLLTRWMQAGVFIPVMRVHSTRTAVPHFPFLWGDDAAAAMRLALNLRYQLVPYHYSNAHAAYASGVPMMRPLAMEFESDAYASTLTRTWMDGDSLLAAPVLNEDNSTAVYLPAGSWFAFGDSSGATKPLAGPLNLTLSSQPLDAMPLYVRAGSIVPLAPVVQRTDLLPGGPLEVRVYGGADASFAMVEDDGETDAYISTAGQKAAMRTTTYSWDDKSATLSWKVEGAFSDSHTFTQLKPTLFLLAGGVKTADVQAIGTSGTVHLA